MAGMDDEGHLTFRSDGSTNDGLCHCDRNEAHHDDPGTDPGVAWQMALERVRKRLQPPAGE